MAELVRAGDPAAVPTAARALEGGELVVVPTDTVYGIAARPDAPGATGRLFAAKRRARERTLPVLVADLEQAERVGLIDDRVRILAAAHWPGPLTIVVRRTDRARTWDLGDEEGTVGLRVPAHETTVALLRAAGPLAVTSANRSGEPTPPSCEAIAEILGDEIAVYLCAEPSASDLPSTVVDLTGEEVRVLREGPLPQREVLATLGPLGSEGGGGEASP